MTTCHSGRIVRHGAGKRYQSLVRPGQQRGSLGPQCPLLAMLGFVTYIMAGSPPHALERQQHSSRLGRRYNAGPQRGDERFSGKGEFPPHPGDGQRVRGNHRFIVPYSCAQRSRYHATGRMGAPPHARPSPCCGICIPSPVYHGERGKGGK